MKSPLAKVLHPILGKPMLHYPADCARTAGSEEIVIVVGHQAESIKERMGGEGLLFADQKEQLGTGHAVRIAGEHFRNFQGTVLILCGDVPLLRPETVQALLERHIQERAVVTVLTTILENPHGYGRIIKAEGGDILKITEERDATPAEREVREINTGIYCVETPFLFDAVGRIGNRNAQREYYLTDIIGIAVESAMTVRAFIAQDADEVMGINTMEDLQRAEGEMKRRLRG